jgi:hypothetical protein
MVASLLLSPSLLQGEKKKMGNNNKLAAIALFATTTKNKLNLMAASLLSLPISLQVEK